MSYVVTVIGLPLAIAVFLYEQRKERENEEEAVYFADAAQSLSGEQRERQLILFDMLVSLFERAYLLLYEDRMTPNQARRWHSWEDYMAEWCRRPDFRASLPRLLRGEAPDFVRYLEKVVVASAADQ